MIDQFSLGRLYTIQIQLYINVACIALWTYEFGITIVSEISFIWKSPWSVPKVLFLLTRYLPLISLIITVLFHALPNLSTDACLGMDKYISWAVEITALSTEIVLSIRTWVVYNRNRKMGIILLIMLVAGFVTSFTLQAFWLTSLENNSPPRSLVPSGCYPLPRSRWYIFNFIIPVVLEGVLVIIMLAKGRGFISTKACSYLASTSDRSSGVFDTSNLGDLKTPLKSIVYIDGVLYYIALFLLSLTNLILNSVLPQSDANLLLILQHVVHSILACRVLLRIRAFGKRAMHRDTDLDVSSTGMSIDNTSVAAAGPLQSANDSSF